MRFDEASYLIGVFGGEGCITTVRSQHRWAYVHVELNMASAEIVDRFAARWGGATGQRRGPTAGGLLLYQWRITGHGAQSFLELLAEHSATKRTQARLALRILELTMVGPRGNRRVSRADGAKRERLSAALRAANSARSRFAA